MKMSPEKFIRTVYLGDRLCKCIVIDSHSRELKIQVDSISRIRSENWNYYTDEDLDNGFIVFEGVRAFSFSPCGPIPDDLIISLEVEHLSNSSEEYEFKLCIDSVGVGGQRTEVSISIVAKDISLEDARMPGQRIRK